MHFFSGNYQSKYSSGFLFVAGSEIYILKLLHQMLGKHDNFGVFYRPGFGKN